MACIFVVNKVVKRVNDMCDKKIVNKLVKLVCICVTKILLKIAPQRSIVCKVSNKMCLYLMSSLVSK